jgi:SsrA-binding protein
MAKKRKRKVDPGDVASNRRARHRYEILESFEAGIELLGSEVKSLRSGKAQIAEAYAAVEGGEVWLRNAHIPPYEPAADQNHEPERPRKLLLHRREINRLIGQTQKKGLTLVPLRMYFKGPRAKLELALVRGKEQRDRRRELRERDQKREIDRELSRRQRGR